MPTSGIASQISFLHFSNTFFYLSLKHNIPKQNSNICFIWKMNKIFPSKQRASALTPLYFILKKDFLEKKKHFKISSCYTWNQNCLPLPAGWTGLDISTLPHLWNYDFRVTIALNFCYRILRLEPEFPVLSCLGAEVLWLLEGLKLEPLMHIFWGGLIKTRQWSPGQSIPGNEQWPIEKEEEDPRRLR